MNDSHSLKLLPQTVVDTLYPYYNTIFTKYALTHMPYLNDVKKLTIIVFKL